MGLLSGCPRGAALNAVPIENCVESVGQVQKIVFQRTRKADGTKNFFDVGTADPTLVASWTPLLAAADDTKVVQTPFIAQPEFEPGAARKYGGGNATLGGIEIVIGREPTAVSAMLLRTAQKTIKALKSYMVEEVGVYLVDEYGRIIAVGDGADPATKVYPIPINGLFIGDKKLGGLEDIDSNAVEFGLYPNWSDNLVIITPADFDALNDLKTP
ncbi:major head protein [Croceibacter phage P2559S]|uniref:major head protein n=1 Tax=Croceibacter phage P2559S TaxID=1176422 RepID=UPI0002688E6E|nr:major head protein [Croceibacter phage P2559S]AFM54787.1 putative tail protein [Croceibacter phage P2559S]